MVSSADVVALAGRLAIPTQAAIAAREPQVAVGSELDAARLVVIPRLWNPQQDSLGIRVRSISILPRYREPREHGVDLLAPAARAVVDVESAVLRESGVEGEVHESRIAAEPHPLPDVEEDLGPFDVRSIREYEDPSADRRHEQPVAACHACPW